MRADKMVWVELRNQFFETNAVRIFRSKKAAMQSHAWIDCIPYGIAVKGIRHMLFIRSRGECETCSDTVTEDGGHMHEAKWRGRGGEISLENSLFVCVACHRRAHKERNPQWNKRKR